MSCRDLASNWNIDLAQELEEYIEELEHVTVSFDGGQTSLNFAEAALVIQVRRTPRVTPPWSRARAWLTRARASVCHTQGSACVYSKKVEYLYTLIYQTLDHLAQQHKRAQVRTSLACVVTARVYRHNTQGWRELYAWHVNTPA